MIYGCSNYQGSAAFNFLGPSALSRNSDGYFETRGTAAEWNRLLGRIGTHSSVLRLVAAAALAAPLLAMMGEPPFFVVLTGPSSKGKTTAEIFAGSIIGHPSPERLHNWKLTDARLGEVVRFHNDTLCILDDIATAEGSPKERWESVRGTLHWITAGGRRGRQSGAVERNTGRTDSHLPCWTVVLTSYENPVGELAERARAQADPGDLVRLLDVPVISEGSFGIFDNLPAGSDPNECAARLIDRIRDRAERQHGAIFVEWLRKLVEDPDKAKRSVKAAMKEFRAHADYDHDDSYEERHARRFALLYGALAYAIEVRLLRWSRENCRRAIQKCHAASRVRLIEANGGAADGLVRLEAGIRDPKQFAKWPQNGRPSLSAALCGWRKRQDGKDVITVIGTAFRGFFSSDHQKRAVLHDLKKKGVVPDSKTRDIRVQGSKQKKVRCYILTYPSTAHS
ncbi:MAG: DUF927 domain-containing protein [Rhizomicrobium sp.]